MMIFVILLNLLITLLSASASSSKSTCALTCNKGDTCFSTTNDALDCLSSMPINIEWANATLDVLTQSLENFGFAALYHSTGPPYSISLDIQGELAATWEMVNQNKFTTDLDFQEHVQAIFQKTIDAHTRYSKPYCYNATFLQPFAFDMQVIHNASHPLANEPRLFIMKNLYTDQYQTIYPDIDVQSLIGKEVLLLNGLEFMTEITQWGDTHETRSNNPGVRFNAAYRSYLYRSAVSYNVLPISDLTVTFVDGSSVTLPWLALYGHGLADLSYCAASAVSTSVSSSAAQPTQSKKRRLPVTEDLVESAVTMDPKALKDNRPDRQIIYPASNPTQISCFIQTVTDSDVSAQAKVRNVLVMKVASFSPPGDNYLTAWEGFLNDAGICLSYDYDLLVVDVMQNGGGYVCLGLRLLELIFEEYNVDHTKLQMHYDLPHSKLMDLYIETVNAPNPYPDPQDVEQILNPATQQSFVDGRAYYYPGRNVTQGGKVSWRTNNFALDCREAEALPTANFRPSRFLPRDRVVVVTDGTCGSTCASFTKIPQEAEQATFVGVGGIWDEPMDVSSFAGGFVCNPDYLQNIAKLSGTTFPSFLTYQRWQFGWAAWYSARLPSRPAQFTEQTPAHREAFWGFPHASISAATTTDLVSTLYDRVIANSVVRLAALSDSTVSSNDDSTCTLSTTQSMVLIAAVIVLAVLLATGLGVAVYLYYSLDRSSRKRSASFSKYGVDSEGLLDEA